MRVKLSPEERAARKKINDAKYRRKNREKFRLNSARYYAENKERFVQYANENKERIRINRNARAAKNREKIRARENLYRAKNKERISEKQREWRERNKDHIREYGVKYQATYYPKHKDEAVQRARQWKADNPEKFKEWSENHRKQFPEKFRTRSQKYKAKKKAAKIGDQRPIVAWEKSWRKKKRVRCYWCGNQFPPSQCHADHIQALEIGGSHAIENLCISCGTCNCQKQAKSITEWNSKILEPVLL